MIYRKIFKVKTTGNRKTTGDLRPDWEMAEFMPGVSTVCYEYNEVEGWCICECWVSDHPVRTNPRTMADLNELAKHPSVIEVLQNYPLSPEILGRLSCTINSDVTDVNKTKKTLKRKGKPMKFKYKREKIGTHGRKEEQYVLDEG